MQVKIKTCPFCGHAMEVKKLSFKLSPECASDRWFGNCTNPDCVINTNYKTEEEAITALNTRYTDERIEKRIVNVHIVP